MSWTTRIRRHSTVIPVCILALGLTGVASTRSIGTHVSPATTATVKVTLTDKRLVLSHEGLRTGKTTFLLVNTGRRLHALTINGPGLKREASRTVAAGKRATLSLTLRQGTYLIADPMLGPARARWVTVTPASAASGDNRTVPPASITSVTGMNCDAE